MCTKSNLGLGYWMCSTVVVWWFSCSTLFYLRILIILASSIDSLFSVTSSDIMYPIFFQTNLKTANQNTNQTNNKMSSSNTTTSTVTNCPYLDTIDRTVLDFDSPDHACSITLESSPHIYACLTCGKFFRGRGKQTPAYTHSVETGHSVYIHLTNGTFWCLPDTQYKISLKLFLLQQSGGGRGIEVV